MFARSAFAVQMCRRPLCLASLSFAALALSSGIASAQIRSPRAHPQYQLELEPQVLFRVIDEDGLGLGVRGSLELADPAFIPHLNNTVGITFGLGFTTDNDRCHNHGGGHCHDNTEVLIPVAMQWNFWFTRHWSAFGEPGLSFEFRDNDHDHEHGHDDFDIDPAFTIGGRYNFNPDLAITLRLGVPSSSFGVSFFF